MSDRYFSILRRKFSLLDFSIPQRPASDGVAGFRFKTDTDPGGSFTTVAFNSSLYGFVDPEVAGPQNVIQPGTSTRIIVDPSKHGISDQYAFWLRLYFLDASGAELAGPGPSAPTLVLPPFNGNAQSGFNGTAPSVGSLAASLQVDLPRSMENFRIRNLDATHSIQVAFQEGGPEVEIPPGVESSEIYGVVASFWVRGVGGTAKFTAQFVYGNPR